MRLKSKLAVLISIIVVASAAAVAVSRQPASEDVHLHAAFQLYADGTLANFSGMQYMHIKPCSENEGAHTPEEEQIERAHLHDGIGDVVHVHRINATWGDLFQNLKYALNGEITVFRNGERVNDILSAEIQPYDRVLLYIGNTAQTGDWVESVPSVERIREVESQGESC